MPLHRSLLYRLLPAPPPSGAQSADLALRPWAAYLFLLVGAGLTLSTHLTNPGPLAWTGGAAAVGLLCWAAHRTGYPALAAIDLTTAHCTTPAALRGWVRTGAATTAWTTGILLAGAVAELGARALLSSTATPPAGGATVLLPVMAPTVALLTVALLERVVLHRVEVYTTAALVVMVLGLLAPGASSALGMLPLVASTLGLVWLYGRTRRGLALYAGYLVAYAVMRVVFPALLGL
ncbi:hypothetical protein SAMN05421803_11918 [Nocardiopsis flavescens]|uniref:Uncharacterized protein n=2 Tax=Nocardiopsis flavescens TaxID=758803 RepID=A0A1M6S443_9ACTN|nr:hypothetical protein SAMN05421803_11918 [Nocardiopsis flavescens]